MVSELYWTIQGCLGEFLLDCTRTPRPHKLFACFARFPSFPIWNHNFSLKILTCPECGNDQTIQDYKPLFWALKDGISVDETTLEFAVVVSTQSINQSNDHSYYKRMPQPTICWYFSKEHLDRTPSQAVGYTAEQELAMRREGARLLLDIGQHLSLRYDTCATGLVFFHRFYMFHSFSEFNKYVIACASLFLSGKVEETPKKAKDIISEAQRLLKPEDFSAFTGEPKDELLVAERVLLKVLLIAVAFLQNGALKSTVRSERNWLKNNIDHNQFIECSLSCSSLLDWLISWTESFSTRFSAWLLDSVNAQLNLSQLKVFWSKESFSDISSSTKCINF